MRRYPDRYQAPRTVDQVLDLLAPGRPGTLPDTATGADGEAGTTDTAPMLALAAGLLAFGLITRGRIARRTLQRSSSRSIDKG